MRGKAGKSVIATRTGNPRGMGGADGTPASPGRAGRRSPCRRERQYVTIDPDLFSLNVTVLQKPDEFIQYCQTERGERQ